MQILRTKTHGGELAKTITTKHHNGKGSVVVVIVRLVLVPLERVKDFGDHKIIKEFKSFRLMKSKIAFKASTLHEIVKYLYNQK